MQIIFTLLFLGTALFAAAPPAGTIQVTNVAWTAGPPNLPKGAQIAVLEGDPRTAGTFTIRVKMPAGTRIAPHWHPRPERVTVLTGESQVGFGDTFDAKTMTKFPAGSFYLNPPRAHHFVLFPVETVIQITGDGPWEIYDVK